MTGDITNAEKMTMSVDMIDEDREYMMRGIITVHSSRYADIR